MKTYQLKTYAKLNLCLYIYTANKTGYHPICSVFQNISLHDKITIKTKSKKQFHLTCSHPKVPIDNANLLTKIYQQFQHKIPIGLSIHIQKNIPMGGGLGGGSSNAAGFLLFLNTVCDWNLSTTQLCRIAKKFGADIPFFLTGGTALVRGIGEKITPISCKIPPYFILINPNIHISTASMYNAFDKTNPKTQPTKTPRHIINNPLGHNAFKAIAFDKYPTLMNFEKTLIKNNAPKLYLSGSGATMFMPAQTKNEAQKWTTWIKTNYPDFSTDIVTPTNPELMI